MNLRNIILKRDREQCDLIIDILSDLSNEEIRTEILADSATSLASFKAHDPTLAQMGIFHMHALQLIVLNQFKKRGGPAGLSMQIIEHVIRRFSDEMLVQSGYGPDRISLSPAIHILGKGVGLKSLVYGIEYVAEHLAAAVAVINVRSREGDIECGSGVIFHSAADGLGVLLTNRHVLEDHEIIEIKASGNSIKKMGDAIYCDNADLAKFSIQLPASVPYVQIAQESQILDPIVAMGYPRVPTSIEQTVLAHRGEINGRIRNFEGNEFFAISCHVSPGNSGGPIFTKTGYCAGVVTQSSFSAIGSQAALEFGATTYHLAIPEETIQQFLK